jgi:uncharacterized membrane protein
MQDWKSPKVYMMLVPQIVGLLVIFGVLTPAQGEDTTRAVVGIVSAAFVVIANSMFVYMMVIHKTSNMDVVPVKKE